MIAAAGVVVGVLKAAALGAPVFLRPLLDPRVMILIAAFLAGAKGCDTWHDLYGAARRSRRAQAPDRPGAGTQGLRQGPGQGPPGPNRQTGETDP